MIVVPNPTADPTEILKVVTRYFRERRVGLTGASIHASEFGVAVFFRGQSPLLLQNDGDLPLLLEVLNRFDTMPRYLKESPDVNVREG